MRPIIYFILFCTTACFGQRSAFDSSNKEWTPKDFPQGINKVQAYEFKIKKNGKVKRDSTLLYSQELHKENNSVTGLNYNTSVIIGYNDNVSVSRNYYDFKNFYSSIGKIVSSTDTYNSNKNLEPINQTVYRYEYDLANNLIKETIINKYITVDIDEKTNDTLYVYVRSEPLIQSYHYENDKLISKYTKRDSTQINFIDFDRVHKSDSYKGDYEPPHKFLENNYYDTGKLKLTTWLTRNGENHTKKYFYYDDALRIIKQTDSTGWYISTLKPYVENETTYQYIDEGMIKTKTGFKTIFSPSSKIVTVYNAKDLIVSECKSYGDDIEECDYFEYEYQGSFLRSIVQKNCLGKKIITYYKYNDQGVITEQKDTFEGKTYNLVRYYYN